MSAEVTTAVRAILALSLATLLQVPPAVAQDSAAEPAGEAQEEMAEVTIVSRQRKVATEVLQERLEQPVVADLVNADQIGRVGDSSVSLALRRLPGVTLVNDQFVYIRGLGERYSSTTLNGAYVPSPDLTRNVIPLDLFPAEVIQSLSVQKGYAPDRPAAFGGGNVDIRTRGIPEEPLLDVQIGSGWNSDSDRDVLSYSGGGRDRFGTDDGTRALPGEIREAIHRYQGDLSPNGIFRALNRDGGLHTIAEAQAINRRLATSLNRDVELRAKSTDPDLSLEGAVGNSWSLDEADSWRLGVLGLADYKNQWRNRDRTNRSVAFPDTVRGDTQRSVNQVSITGSANMGLSFAREHEIELGALYLRNSEDESAITTRNNFNFQRDTGLQLRDYRLRFEERDLELYQLRGSHTLGPETLGLLGRFTDLGFAEELTFSWYYSDAKAQTEIPNEVTISALDQVDPETGAVLSTALRSTASAADFRFTELQDEVRSMGWKLEKPFRWGPFALKLSGGWDYYEKGRGYLQTQLALGTTSLAAAPVLVGTPGSVLADSNILDAANGFVLSIGGIGTESYLAAETIDAAFGGFDLTWGGTWRLAGGVRWEDFAQVSVPVDPLEFDPGVGKIPVPIEQLPSLAKAEDDFYPALALTHMRENFWAESFQLRAGFSRTTARPDLREISGATYIDPLSEARVRGNPSLVTSELLNLDLRAEWFFDSGDNFTVSAFYKEITDPIETVEGAGTDDNVALTFINAESAELYGLELEWLKDLGFLSGRLGEWTHSFYFAGNLTLSDSQIRIGRQALNLTNGTRRMTQQADYVANLQLGYDSPGGQHGATLVYNGVGERLFFAGRDGAPDAYEQPFHSLDFIYTYYPTHSFNLKLRAQNLLGERVAIEQGGVAVLEQDYGITLKLDATVRF